MNFIIIYLHHSAFNGVGYINVITLSRLEWISMYISGALIE